MAFIPQFSSLASGRSVPQTCQSSSPLFGRQLRAANLPLQPMRSTQALPRMAVSTNDFRPGTTISVDGTVYRVVESLHVKPGKGAAFVRTKIKNMKTGGSVDKTFRAGEMVPSAILDKVPMQHTYVDGPDYVFMNMENFEEERLNAEQLGETVTKFLMEGIEVEVLKHEEDVLGVEIPKTMTFAVTETDPGIKGNTAQGGGTKPAIIETGAKIMVPLFITTGERIKIDTENSKYLSRDKD